jgi:hypothetical protein
MNVKSRSIAATIRFVCFVILLSFVFAPAILLLALTPMRYRRAVRRISQGHMPLAYHFAVAQRGSRGGDW